MQLYKLYSTRLKDDITTTGEWYALMLFIKKRGYEYYLQKDISKRYSLGSDRDFLVVDDCGVPVPYQEVMNSVNKVNYNRENQNKIAPETESGTIIYPSRYSRNSSAYRYRQEPCRGGSGRWVIGSNYRTPNINKKYWADLQEFNVPNPWKCVGWYDDFDYRFKSKSWKHNTKKRKQWM